MWNVLILASLPGAGSSTVGDFEGGSGGLLADVSRLPETEAYGRDEARRGRNEVREEDMRREVARSAAMLGLYQCYSYERRCRLDQISVAVVIRMSSVARNETT